MNVKILEPWTSVYSKVLSIINAYILLCKITIIGQAKSCDPQYK